MFTGCWIPWFCAFRTRCEFRSGPVWDELDGGPELLQEAALGLGQHQERVRKPAGPAAGAGRNQSLDRTVPRRLEVVGWEPLLLQLLEEHRAQQQQQ